MKINLYAVYDRCSGIYDGPVPGQTDAAVMRDFVALCTKENSKIAQSPEDYTLFRVGTWNDGTAEVEDVVAEKLINGAEALAQRTNGAEV